MWPYTDDEMDFVNGDNNKKPWIYAFKMNNIWIKIKAAV